MKRKIIIRTDTNIKHSNNYHPQSQYQQKSHILQENNIQNGIYQFAYYKKGKQQFNKSKIKKNILNPYKMPTLFNSLNYSQQHHQNNFNYLNHLYKSLEKTQNLSCHNQNNYFNNKTLPINTQLSHNLKLSYNDTLNLQKYPKSNKKSKLTQSKQISKQIRITKVQKSQQNRQIKSLEPHNLKLKKFKNYTSHHYKENCFNNTYNQKIQQIKQQIFNSKFQFTHILQLQPNQLKQVRKGTKPEKRNRKQIVTFFKYNHNNKKIYNRKPLKTQPIPQYKQGDFQNIVLSKPIVQQKDYIFIDQLNFKSTLYPNDLKYKILTQFGTTNHPLSLNPKYNNNIYIYSSKTFKNQKSCQKKNLQQKNHGITDKIDINQKNKLFQTNLSPWEQQQQINIC